MLQIFPFGKLIQRKWATEKAAETGAFFGEGYA